LLYRLLEIANRGIGNKIRTDKYETAIPNDNNWHLVEFTASQAPAGTELVTITVGKGGGSGTYLYDDVWFAAFPPNGGPPPPDSLTFTPSTSTVEQFGYVFLDISTPSSFSDPYDPCDIRVDAIIDAPDLSQIVLPCFYVSGSSGNSQWEGRFTPRQVGSYSCRVEVYVGGVLDATSTTQTLTVTSSTKDGFLHMNPSSYYTLIHDSGKRFRGVGENIGWEGERGYNDFGELFSLLADNGGNFVRVWTYGLGDYGDLQPPLEWTTYGLGKPNPVVAAKIDDALALAESNGLYMMLALDYHGVLKTVPDYWGGSDFWWENPYYEGNNGPCADPADFFAEETAKEIYKRRLRYIVARWGYHPYLCAFEFFNEVDQVVVDEGVPVSSMSAWHGEMAGYLKSIDQYDHLVTTSLAYSDYPSLWNLPDMDISRRHEYGLTDNIYDTHVSFAGNYGKPFVAGEFSRHWQGPWEIGTPASYERELHMGLWRGMFSPTPILPLTWWWDWHADPEPWNDYFHFGTASIFLDNMVADDTVTLHEISVSTSPNVEEMGVQAGDGTFVWLLNNTGSATSVTTTISGMVNGKYEVSFYNTWNGTYYSPTTETVTTGTLQPTTPASLADDEDIAILVKQLPTEGDGIVNFRDFALFAQNWMTNE